MYCALPPGQISYLPTLMCCALPTYHRAVAWCAGGAAAKSMLALETASGGLASALAELRDKWELDV